MTVFMLHSLATEIPLRRLANLPNFQYFIWVSLFLPDYVAFDHIITITYEEIELRMNRLEYETDSINTAVNQGNI